MSGRTPNELPAPTGVGVTVEICTTSRRWLGFFRLAKVVCIPVVIFTLVIASSCTPDPPAKIADPAVERLIDRLTEIDSQTSGLLSMATDDSFIAEDKPAHFAGGVLGSPTPKNFPPMKELVRRGVAAIPSLIQHLNDKRPTGLTIGGKCFTFAFFGDEYDPKDISQRSHDHELKRADDPKFEVPARQYTFRVGDVWYALIGQIVNRNLLPVRYQPSQGFVINSPIETPALIQQVKRDWQSVDETSHLASLLSDAVNDADPDSPVYVLERLRFYYPEEYGRQKNGSLRKQIAQFETNENK